MSPCETFRHWRDALVGAMIPRVGEALPGASELDLAPFWARFEGAAPWHLRIGLRVSIVVLALILPLATCRLRTISRLSPEQRDQLLRRAHRLPLLAQLVDIVKVVACLGYFADDRVIAAAKKLS